MLCLFLYFSLIPYLWMDYKQFAGLPLFILCYLISCFILFIYDKRQQAHDRRIEYFKPSKEKAVYFFILVLFIPLYMFTLRLYGWVLFIYINLPVIVYLA